MLRSQSSAPIEGLQIVFVSLILAQFELDPLAL